MLTNIGLTKMAVVLCLAFPLVFDANIAFAGDADRLDIDLIAATINKTNSPENYLPTVDGRVVCASLIPKYNPDAPGIITPGFGPQVQKLAEMLCNQGGPIPVFLKRRVNEWEYCGEYEVNDFTTDSKKRAEYEARAGSTASGLLAESFT
jgi:hypothetical protein